jgi:hypothetical protein
MQFFVSLYLGVCEVVGIPFFLKFFYDLLNSKPGAFNDQVVYYVIDSFGRIASHGKSSLKIILN